MAAHSGEPEVTKVLLLSGAKVEVRSSPNGTTALLLAARGGRHDVVRLLLEARADTTVCDHRVNGGTALHLGSQHGHEEVVKLLLEAGANVDAKNYDRDAPLHFAARYGHKTIVQLLLDANAEINERENKGFTPLGLAVQLNHREVVDMIEALDKKRKLSIKGSLFKFAKKR